MIIYDHTAKTRKFVINIFESLTRPNLKLICTFILFEL